MNMRQYRHDISALLMLATALLLIACSSDEVTPPTATPITLGASVQDAAVTRNGANGCINYSALARSNYGFGVYAFGTKEWTNKQVTYQGSETNPVSELGDVHVHPGNWFYDTEEDWTSTDNISFLAYAPYVSAGSGNTGIKSITASDVDNTTIDYGVANTLANSVDLLWGVKGKTGKPWLNTTLSMTGGPVIFTFHHALAAIGFHVQAMIDKENNEDDLEDESGVVGILGTSAKITIESVTVTGPFYSGGTLNLNNSTANTPNWTSKTPATPSSTEMTLSVANGDIEDALRYHSDKTAADLFLTENASITGVTQTAQQLLLKRQDGIEQCFFVLPNAAQDYTVTLNWYVSGKNTSGAYVAKQHTSTMTVKDWQLKHDTKYYLNFIIGLKTVKFDITAEDWQGDPQDVSVLIEHGTSANSSLAPRR